jgi:hypothetical protein
LDSDVAALEADVAAAAADVAAADVDPKSVFKLLLPVPTSFILPLSNSRLASSSSFVSGVPAVFVLLNFRTV